MPTTTTMAAELAKVYRICRYADGVCTIGFRKTHERADPMCRLHGSTSRGTVPPARAKASARPAQEPPLGEQEGEEGHQPRTVREELETAGHDQMKLFVTRKRLHMQYPPDPLDKWIAHDIQLSPGGDYVDNTAGETLNTEEREKSTNGTWNASTSDASLGERQTGLCALSTATCPKGPRDPQKDPGKEKAATRGSSHTAKGRATRGVQTCQHGGGCGAAR